MKEEELTPEQRLREQLLRLRADFDNYRKRTAQHFERLAGHAKEEFIKRLLPLADDLELALEALPREDGAARQGFEIISRKLFSVLDAEGVERVGAAGDRFDPEIHEAVSVEENGQGDEGMVRAVLQPGYRMGEVLLRPARVTVTVGKPMQRGQGGDN